MQAKRVVPSREPSGRPEGVVFSKPMAPSTLASLSQGQRPSMTSPGRRRAASLLALGVTLARRGPLAVVAMVVSAMTVVVLCAVAVAFARRGGDAPVQSVPVLASSALAWGGGFLQAVSVSAGALRRDHAEGIRHLLVSRTTTLHGYLLARVGGLAAALTAVVAGGTLLVALVALAGAGRAHTVATIQSSFGAVVYALAFAFVMAPVAFATLGPRARLSGYAALMLVLVLPEMSSIVLTGPVPSEVTEVMAIPSALAALRSSIAPGSVEPLRFVRAIVAVTLYAGVALFLVRRRLLVAKCEEP